MRAAGLFRVSDEDQVDGYSLDAQRRNFFEFCQRKGWDGMKTYTEEGRSAWGESIDRRPVFRSMLNDSGLNQFDVVVVDTFDRFSRNMLVTMEAFKILTDNHVAFACVKQDLDYSTPEGRLFMVMLGGFAQYFSDNLSGHTKKGMKERAKQGMFNGEPPWPYERCTPECFGIDETHTGCHVDPEKGRILVELFERYATGTYSQASLAEWLNGLGFRTKGRRRKDSLGREIRDAARKFTGSSIRDLLNNPFFVGMVRYKGELFPGRHQPLVDPKLFEKVQLQSQENRSRRSSGGRQKTENAHLLTGLIRCYECGTPLWSQTQGRESGTYYKSPAKGFDTQCDYRGQAFVGWPVDEQMAQIFRDFTLRENWINWIIDNYVLNASVTEAVKRREAIQGRLERARHLYVVGDMPWDEYTKIKYETNGLLASAYIPEFDDVVEAGKILSDFRDLWQCASVAQRNRMLRTMLHAVYVDPERKQLIGLAPKDAFYAPILAMAERDDVAVVATEVSV